MRTNGEEAEGPPPLEASQGTQTLLADEVELAPPENHQAQEQLLLLIEPPASTFKVLTVSLESFHKGKFDSQSCFSLPTRQSAAASGICWMIGTGQDHRQRMTSQLCMTLEYCWLVSHFFCHIWDL